MCLGAIISHGLTSVSWDFSSLEATTQDTVSGSDIRLYEDAVPGSEIRAVNW
jgi:hypothetical protein